MRTRAVLTSIFASVGVLVVGWQLGAAAATQTTISTASASAGTKASTGTTTAAQVPVTASAPAPTAAAAAPTHKGTDGTFTGTSVDTRYGSVQVQVTVASGTITAVTALHLTDADGRSVQISNRAAPTLAHEVLAAQSAKVSNVSGATYTTEAYLASVQSALDQAGL